LADLGDSVVKRVIGFATLAALAASGLGVGFAQHASAAEECWFDYEKGVQRCRITAEPGGTDTTIPFDGVPIAWRRYVAYSALATGFCYYVDTIDGVDTTVIGIPWFVELINTETGETISITAVCEFPGEDPPQPPPPPPTPEEYIEAIEGLLEVDWELSPPATFEGITGVDTWFWCDTPDTSVIDPITLNGWTVQSEMTAILFRWAVTGPGPGGNHDSDTCGEAPAPDGDGDGAAWIWQPQTMGDYAIEFTSTWLGTWTLTYEGTNTGTFPLGPAAIGQPPVAYPVGEYRGVLVPGDDQ